MTTPGEPVPQAEAGTSSSTRCFPFRFAGVPGIACRPFGVTRSNASVTVSVHEVEARFGPWRVTTPLANVAEVTTTGPYHWWFVAGPAHLSRTDHGLTFATNDRAGACLRFHEPVPPAFPWPRWEHPGLTVTVDDVAGLAALVRERIQPTAPLS
ncbi:MAG TPA: hypothetical protein VHK88_15855 [Aquihabitans sp.]|nr:hypothetical protein [Aquihabitans sp.]